MKPSTYRTISHERLATPADTTTVRTATIPKNTSAIEIAVETTNARVTFDGTTPVTGTTGLVLAKDLQPQLFPVGPGSTIKYVSTAAAISVMQLWYLE